MDADGCMTCHASITGGEPDAVVLTDLAADYTLDELVGSCRKQTVRRTLEEQERRSGLELGVLGKQLRVTFL